jgi:hypothetical protein
VGTLIEQILFSDIMIIGLLGLVIILLSVWARNLREWAGYILGWLVGIFFILMLITLLPPAPPLDPTAPAQPDTLTFWELIVPSFFGLLIGFGLLFLIRLNSATDNRVRRALMVAGLMSFTLVAGYLVLRSNISDRVGLAIFILTFAIGALINYILTRSMASRNAATRAL